MYLRTLTVASVLAAALLPWPAGARADEPQGPPRYELLLSPTLDAECGARLVSSAVTATGSGEERLFRRLEPGPGGIALRTLRLLAWDAPVAWWYGVALHEGFGHGGRAREFHTSPSVHLGSPWGGRDSYASFDLDGTTSENRLHIYAGGAEANTLAASFLERRAVEGVAMRPIELLYLASNRLVASDYVLRTTPDPEAEPARFHAEYSGGGDVANYLGLLHELHVGGSGIGPASVDATIVREYRRLRRQAVWNLLDPGLWWALASAMRQTARGDASSPVPLPRAGRFRHLPVLSAEWTPSGGQTSIEWILAPVTAGTAAPRTFSFVARRGAGPAGAFGALGASAEDLMYSGRWALGVAAEIWHDPRGGPGGGARLRARLTRGYLRGLYVDAGAKSQGYWIGQPASPGPYVAVGLLLGLIPEPPKARLGAT
jgi:hypothetical protein